MPVESIAFVLIGLLVGAVALVAFPELFPPARSLTLGTALVAALLSGVVAHYALAGALPALILAISAAGSALLVSVLARQDRTPRGAARRSGTRRHGHRRQRHA